ncbi:hypothetical protein [Cellulomonas rhizosphaerae]|uniref:Uncharacterized protein n=1 Tax=Cellulomonas rhizosphaerae TaxID=2293719 RepID=A0A413RH19_9CELL|nr:hypothetical protein [Cellulomonas rhizosphaerae]RHA37109.1 hypothetical protein D1825_17625 [Cellulomonas rhizosphaerae]
MGDRLTVDTDGLREAGSALRAVAAEFDAADANSDAVAEHVGHDELAAAVRDFAHGWDDRRAEMVQDVASLAQSCDGVGGAFEDLDLQFAAVLRGDA